LSRKKNRVFRRELKLESAKRMARGENVSALSRELQIPRAVLYRWKDEYREEGLKAFRRKAGRPPKTSPQIERARAEAAAELAAAQQRIAELERKIGQQQVDLDFFRLALRQAGATMRASFSSAHILR
jgi:transposase